MNDITNLEIAPKVVEHGISRTLATGRATFNDAITAPFKINERRDGIYVVWIGIGFANDAARKEASNRVLATYVINHCISDYETTEK